MRVIHLAGAATFHDPESGATYEAGPDGVFDMPEHVGTHYTTRHAGMFRRESDHEKLIAAAKAETLRDPNNTPGTLQALLERVGTLEAKVAQWDAWLGAPPAGSPEAQAPDAGDGTAQDPRADDAPGTDASGESEDDTEADEPDDDSDDDEDGSQDTPLRKPTPRKTAAKRRS